MVFDSKLSDLMMPNRTHVPCVACPSDLIGRKHFDAVNLSVVCKFTTYNTRTQVLYLAVDGLTSTWQDNMFSVHKMSVCHQVGACLS